MVQMTIIYFSVFSFFFNNFTSASLSAALHCSLPAMRARVEWRTRVCMCIGRVFHECNMFSIEYLLVGMGVGVILLASANAVGFAGVQVMLISPSKGVGMAL